MVKNLPASAGDKSSIPGSGRVPGEGNGNPLQCSFFFFFFLIFGCAGSLSWAFSGCGARASHCGGFSLLQSVGSRRAGSGVVAHRLSCPEAYGVFQGQGSNPCPLHW